MSRLYSISSLKHSIVCVEKVLFSFASVSTTAGSIPLFLRSRTGLLPFDDVERGVVSRGELWGVTISFGSYTGRDRLLDASCSVEDCKKQLEEGEGMDEHLDDVVGATIDSSEFIFS